ncbi:MAG: YbjN domain-containing protein [Candidatus Lokiarchaeota archaeon]|nr:YbjN domain-containing protein [Candidatus Lokiarchaeota archaeon]
MNVADLKVLLTQNVGLQVDDHGTFITSVWKISDKVQKQIVFFPDDETKLVYVSIRFEERCDDPGFLAALLRENLKLSVVKFCMDKDGRFMALAELPDDFVSDDLIRRALYGLYTAAGRFQELLAAATGAR